MSLLIVAATPADAKVVKFEVLEVESLAHPHSAVIVHIDRAPRSAQRLVEAPAVEIRARRGGERQTGVCGHIPVATARSGGMMQGKMGNPDSLSDSIAALLQRAVAAHQSGDLATAEQLYRLALDADPGNFDALHLLGVIHVQRGENEEAVRALDRAIAANAGVATAHYNRAVALMALQRSDEALAGCERALALQPGYADALSLRGNALKALGHLDDALASYAAALASEPGHAEAHNNRGSTLLQLRRFDEALADYDEALALNPVYAEAHANRGVALQELRRFDEALASFDAAIRLNPNHADTFCSLGNLMQEIGRPEDALKSYDIAVELKPDNYEAHYNRGNTLVRLKRFADAIASFDRALALKPDIEFLAGARLHARMHLCDWTDFDADCARVIDAVARGEPASPPFALLPIPSDPDVQLICARTYATKNHPPLGDARTWPRRAHDKLRIAYVSGDFHAHATAVLMAGLFESHDRARFETCAISFGPDDGSEMRQRLVRAFDRFIDVRELGDEQVVTLMRELEIDIAVDLKGFTHDARTNIFARGAAPVQASYLGYPGTLGADYIDYLIADRVVVPPDEERHYAEKIVCLPGCYQVNDRTRALHETSPTRAALGLPAEGFVFCSFNDNYKIVPEVFDFWMRLLRSVDGSVLWLLAGNPGAPDNLRREAEARGVAAGRLIFAPRAPLADHLARHRAADLFLDTFPCNAHTTASDALWAGLPLLTCAGRTFASRVAGSLLHAIGLPELMTQSLADCEAMALKLAREPAHLASLRQRLAANRDTHQLFDTARSARQLEAAYTMMWQGFARGEGPAGFSVPPMS